MKLAVLMSTYNGERFLREQIDSILGQKLDADIEMTLYIRDDGSSDDTLTIINEYTEKYSEIVMLKSHGNLGCLRSFMLLTQYAEENGADFYAFADQDDIWLPEKLQFGIEALKKSNNPKGALYFSNKIFVDEKAKVIGYENITFYDDYIEILWTSLASGCTMVFDDKLAKSAVKHIPTADGFLHDSWIYRLARVIGADIIFDSNPQIYYRIHENNVRGMSSLSLYGNLNHMIKSFANNIFAKRNHYFQKMIREIADNYHDDISNENKIYSAAILSYNSDLMQKRTLLTAKEMKKRPLKMRLIWCYKILFNML